MGSKKQTTKVTPWAPAEGAIKDSLSGLQTANAATQASIAKYTPALDSAIQGIQNNMASPPAYLTDARNQLDKTINGDYLGKNPYASGLADQIAQKTGSQYNQTFGAAGRSSGGLAALLSSQGVGDALNSFYSNQYNTERSLQQQAIGAAPSFHQDQYTDSDRLLGMISGTSMLPMQGAQAYGNGVTTVSSPYTTTTQKQSGGMLPALLGAAMQIGGSFIPGVGPAVSAMGGAMGGGGMGGLLGGMQAGNSGFINGLVGGGSFLG